MDYGFLYSSFAQFQSARQLTDLREVKAGFWQPQVGYKSFQPHPINHTFTGADPELNVLLEEATFKLGERNTYSELAPRIDLFIQMHVVKEATQSSRIEGTKTALDEANTWVLLLGIPGLLVLLIGVRVAQWFRLRRLRRR